MIRFIAYAMILLKSKRLGWLRNVTKIDGTRLSKKTLESKIQGTRKAGWPGLRWLEDEQTIYQS
jgi:hypothetical protein